MRGLRHLALAFCVCAVSTASGFMIHFEIDPVSTFAAVLPNQEGVGPDAAMPHQVLSLGTMFGF